jgi:predicted nuclease of predicted toxin-antitoxin system
VLRFFADHCISNFIIQTLRDAGHEVIRLRDAIPVNSPDEIVIGQAQTLEAILISLDSDFLDIVAYPPADYRGIVALQVRNRPEAIPRLMERLTDHLAANPSPAYYAGKLFLVEAHRIRIRD